MVKTPVYSKGLGYVITLKASTVLYL
jgi:hypothetical protein